MIMPNTLGPAVRQIARNYPDYPALISDAGTMTFAELDRRADVLAQALLQRGVSHGTHVAVWLPICEEWVILFCALARIGAVIVPINTRYRTDEVGYTLVHSDVTMLFTQRHLWSLDTSAVLNELAPSFYTQTSDRLELPEMPLLRSVVFVGDDVPQAATRYAALIEGVMPGPELAAAESAVTENDLLLICSTSGSTGRPKGVMHAHRVIEHCREIGNAYGLKPGEIMLAQWPLHHAGGFFSMMIPALVSGTTMVAMPQWNGSHALDLIERHKITVLGGIGTHYFDLITDPTLPSRDISSLRCCYTGGAAISPATYQSYLDGLGVNIILFTYGMTENACSTTFNTVNDPIEVCRDNRAPVTPGCEVRIVNPETLKDVPRGEQGEIWCRGAVMLGYYKDPEATSAAIVEDGWLRTGDLGVYDQDGFVKPVGRLKDMLKVGGSNVAPAEVERYIDQHEDILNSVVVGVPDDRLDEVPYAFVVVESGRSLVEQDVIAHCRSLMANYKVPRYVAFVKDYPRLSSGKVDRKTLVGVAAETVHRLKAQSPEKVT